MKLLLAVALGALLFWSIFGSVVEILDLLLWVARA